MGYKLEKPYTIEQRADFVCEHQGLNYYEDDNCIVMYLDSESVTGGVVTDISETDEYREKLKTDRKKLIVTEYKEYFNELNALCSLKVALGLCTTVQIIAKRAELQTELNTKLQEIENG